MSVTLVDVDATWVNPDTVTYDAGELRRADAAMFASAGIVRTSDSSLRVSVDGSDLVTVQQGSWVVPGNAVVGSGVWRGGIAAAVTGNLEARDATNGRIDLVVARQLDTDVVGTHSAYTGRIEIIPGAPSATPGVPDLPSMAVELGRITVPASGGGAASVDLSHRRYATAVGGEIVVPTASLLPTDVASGQHAFTLDAFETYRFDGTNWSRPGFGGTISGDLNNLTKPGTYRESALTTNRPATASANAAMVTVFSSGDGFVVQTFWDRVNSDVYFRMMWSGAWLAWAKVSP